MTLFSTFTLYAGALLALLAIVAAWLFRTAAAPLWAKVLVPALTVAAACYAPLTVGSLMGFPASVTMADLPEQADLVFFFPRDKEKVVDLWLIIPPAAAPRSFEIALDENLKKTLREAEQAMEHGQRAVLVKRPVRQLGASDRLGIGDDQNTYMLDPSAMSVLPPKE